MAFIVTWFIGEDRLWKPFWLGGGVLGLLVSSLFVTVIVTEALPFVVAYVLFLGFQVWLMVSVWNCAYNVDWRGWGHMARGVIVLGAVTWVFHVVLTVSNLGKIRGILEGG